MLNSRAIHSILLLSCLSSSMTSWAAGKTLFRVLGTGAAAVCIASSADASSLRTEEADAIGKLEQLEFRSDAPGAKEHASGLPCQECYVVPPSYVPASTLKYCETGLVASRLGFECDGCPVQYSGSTCFVAHMFPSPSKYYEKSSVQCSLRCDAKSCFCLCPVPVRETEEGSEEGADLDVADA